MSLYKNTYRVETARLPDYDYSQAGAYYITICTKNHEHFFGQVSSDKVELTKKVIPFFTFKIHNPKFKII